MAEDIIITPASGKFDFYDSGDTLTTWVIEAGTLNFKRGGTTYLALDNTYPNFRVTNADLKLITSLTNNSGSLIGTSGWSGARQPTGPTGAQGATGATGNQGFSGATGGQGAQGNKGGQGAQGIMLAVLKKLVLNG